MSNKIGIIGTGKLGLSFALLCARSGYEVYGYDKRRDYIDSLKSKTLTSHEPSIEEYLDKYNNFHPTNKLSDLLINNCNILFCFVATPSLPDGSYDHSAIDEVIESLEKIHGHWALDGKTLVIGCTTMPGYTASISHRLHQMGMEVVYNPEFIAQGSIIQGLRNADMILIGSNKESTISLLTDIYRSIMDEEPIINSMSPTAAEITKIAINCFLALKISYANNIGQLAIRNNLENEVSTILSAIGSDSRIGKKYLKYGFGYGGPCIPRDGRALSKTMFDSGVSSVLPKAADQINIDHSKFLSFNYGLKNMFDKKPFIFKQLSYKKGVDMLVESQQLKLCIDLLEDGYNVIIDEIPSVIKQVKPLLEKYGDRVIYGSSLDGILINI